MPVVPTPPTISPGILTTSGLNQFRDAIRFLESPPNALLRQTSAQTLTTGVAAAITFNAEDVDTDVDGVGGHDNATNNSRWTARYSGWYDIAGGVTFAANVTGLRLCWWRVNGTDVNGSLVELGATGGGAVTAVAARATKVFLAVGDFVELVAFQTSGGNLNTSVTTTEQSHMSVKWATQ